MIKEPERLASWRDTQNNHGPYAGCVFHGGPHKDCVHCGKVPLRNGHWLGCPALEGKGCACANRDALPAATLDLDELERLAKIAQAYAGAVENNGWSRDHLHPSVVIALIERVRELERYKAAAIKTMDALTREYEALERAAKAAGVKDA